MSVFTRSLDKHTAEKVCMHEGGKEMERRNLREEYRDPS